MTLYQMLQDVERAFGVRVCVHDTSGATFTAHQLQLPYEWKSHSCAFCKAVKNHMGLDYCLERKGLALRLLRRKGVQPYFGICGMGMCDYVLPVEQDGRLLAVVFASGVTLEDRALCREKLIRALANTQAPSEALPEELDRMAEKCTVTREGLRFFAEMTRDCLLRYVVGQYALPQEKNMPYPIEAMPQRRSGVIASVVTYLNENYTGSVHVSWLAGEYFISEGYLSRLFRSEMGVSIKEYIRDKRVAAAAQALVTGDTPIAEIGASVGWGDANYFTRVFSKCMGMTPGAYRRLHREEEQQLRSLAKVD